MAFSFNCPSCNAEREASRKIIGRRVRCPECGHVSRVPDPRDALQHDEDFDPYYQWLAIPEEEQPPNHYRLLGVKEFEPDTNVIAVSADRQMVHVKAQASGRYATQSQKLLNELAKARTCLLDPLRKQEYDDQLRSEFEKVQLTAPGDSNTRDTSDGDWTLAETASNDDLGLVDEPSEESVAIEVAESTSNVDAEKTATLAPLEPVAPVKVSPELLKPLAAPSLTPVGPAPPPVIRKEAEEEKAPEPMTFRDDADREDAEMDMTPMVDVTFLLLIFFMVTAAFSLQKSVPMPAEKQDEPSTQVVQMDPEDDPDYVQIFIDSYNTYHVTTVDWEEEAPSDHELAIKLKRAAQGDGGKAPTKLLVTAHGDASYEKVIKAMDLGTDVGIRQIQVVMTEEDEL